MSTTVEIILAIVIFYAGLGVGFFLKHWLLNRSGFDGAIIITQNEDKTIYSIELHEEPEMLHGLNEVVLKVKKLP